MDGEHMVPAEGLLRDRGDIGRATTRRPRTVLWLVIVGLLFAVLISRLGAGERGLKSDRT